MKYVIFLVLIFNFFNAHSKNYSTNNYVKKVLFNNNTNKALSFGKDNMNGGEERILKYLEKIKTKKGNTFKISSFTLLWGYNKRAANPNID